MEKISFETPALYGDHHVSEVRRILLSVQGVVDAYVSSAFQVIEVTFEPEKILPEKIESLLLEAGYLGDIPILTETGIPVERREGDKVFRHTAVYETVKNTVAFAQSVEHSGRALWPCPGLGPIKMNE